MDCQPCSLWEVSLLPDPQANGRYFSLCVTTVPHSWDHFMSARITGLWCVIANNLRSLVLVYVTFYHGSAGKPGWCSRRLRRGDRLRPLPAVKYAGPEVTEVTLAHNSLARLSHLASATAGRPRSTVLLCSWEAARNGLMSKTKDCLFHFQCSSLCTEGEGEGKRMFTVDYILQLLAFWAVFRRCLWRQIRSVRSVEHTLSLLSLRSNLSFTLLKSQFCILTMVWSD